MVGACQRNASPDMIVFSRRILENHWLESWGNYSRPLSGTLCIIHERLDYPKWYHSRAVISGRWLQTVRRVLWYIDEPMFCGLFAQLSTTAFVAKGAWDEATPRLNERVHRQQPNETFHHLYLNLVSLVPFAAPKRVIVDSPPIARYHFLWKMFL